MRIHLKRRQGWEHEYGIVRIRYRMLTEFNRVDFQLLSDDG
jgi:hypothetical protein